MIETLPGAVLSRWVRAYHEALTVFSDDINALNVYPVPDGDTGTNMRLTMEAVVSALDRDSDPIDCLVRESVMAARGNSGVILSQILKGLGLAVAEFGDLTAESLRAGLKSGSDYAYAAVLKPVEGTILTVARKAAERAQHSEATDLPGLVSEVLEASRAALSATPEQLEILKQAGVVDAGGRGFVLLLESLLNILDGTPLPEPSAVSTTPVRTAQKLEFDFEVQFLLSVPDGKVEDYRLLLGDLGDCVLVVGGAGEYNVHVHTNEMGKVIEEAIAIGRPRQIEITHMAGQVAALHDADVIELTTPDEIGFVALGSGDGILTIFRSMGVKGLVRGGQTFNPSAAEILQGIRDARAERVIVLPNNRNVIASARTAADAAIQEGLVKEAIVVPTESPLQAFAALISLDQTAGLTDIVEAMTVTVNRTRHGEVAFAIRTSETPAGHVNEGQCLGLADSKVVVVGDDPNVAVMGVVGRLNHPDAALVTLVYGEGIDEWSAHELGKRVEDKFALEVEVHHGGQPHYPYLIGLE